MIPKIELGALKSKNFRWYFIGMGVSLCGTWLQYIALGWLIYRLSASATLLGLSSLVGGLPLLILPPLLGNFIDKIDKRKLLLCTQSLFFLLAFTLAILTITHAITYPLILFLSLLSGVVFSLDQPLRQVLIPSLIEKQEDLPNAIAWAAFLNNFARIIGPIVGGLLILRWGEGICFLADSLSFLIMILAIYQINWKMVSKECQKNPFWQAWRLSFNYIRKSKLIMQSLILTFIASSTLGTYTLLLPVITRNIYHGNSLTQGYLLTASGVGAIVASLLMTAQENALNKLIRKILACSFMAIVSSLILVNSASIGLGVVAITFLGGSMITIAISLNAILQKTADESKRGMVMSFFTTAYLGAIPLSNFSASLLTDQVGVQVTLSGLSLLFLISVIYFMYRLRGEYRLSPHQH